MSLDDELALLNLSALPPPTPDVQTPSRSPATIAPHVLLASSLPPSSLHAPSPPPPPLLLPAEPAPSPTPSNAATRTANVPRSSVPVVCAPCRNSHIKCDLGKPACNQVPPSLSVLLFQHSFLFQCITKNRAHECSYAPDARVSRGSPARRNTICTHLGHGFFSNGCARSVTDFCPPSIGKCSTRRFAPSVGQLRQHGRSHRKRRFRAAVLLYACASLALSATYALLDAALRRRLHHVCANPAW